uniref:ribonuclease H n=1 Tax=Oryzias sinensis TaxID=183150 RepID=A0A8C7YHL6_9TELE
MDSAQQDLFRRLDSMTQTLLELTGQLSGSAAPVPAPPSVNLGTSASSSNPENYRLQPEPFLVDVENCGGFLLQCELLFQQAPRYYHSDHSKITLVVNSLRSKALQWAQAFLAANPITHLPFKRFIGEFRLVFDQPRKQEEATRRLLNLKQRNRSVSDHVVDFRILAVEAGWTDTALRGIFYQSLNETIKDHLCTQPEALSFEELVAAAMRSDIRLKEHQHERSYPARKTTMVRPPLSELPPQNLQRKTPGEPMQIGVYRLSAEERIKRRDEGLCFYCGGQGHQVSQCPIRLNSRTPLLKDRPRGNMPVVSSRNNFCYIPVKLCYQSKCSETHALVDSGAEQSLIDHALVSCLSLPIETLDSPINAAGLGGQNLSCITHRTKPMLLITSGNHHEYIRFYVTSSPQNPVVLGYSWLKFHNPQFDWAGQRVSNWSGFCLANCLQSAIPPVPPASTSLLEDIDLSSVPSCYHEFKAVFSKKKAGSLPQHRPYDCAIELLPGATLPKGHLYNLSGPEKTAMETYIHEALTSGHIRPSSSPVGAGFFFVEKKDKTLRPCIDYRELNLITVKDKYSHPLISSIFDSVQGAQVFSKLDLRNAYHLVRIKEGDEWKTAFNTPLGHYEYLVMPFGLTNAPAVFQRLVNDVLRDFLNRFVFVYLDDILIFSRDPSQHENHVRSVLSRLLENQLYVKAEKCQFHAKSIPFLGYIFESDQVRPDPAKLEAVSQWEPPSTRKKLQQFLGFANFYRQFIRNYSAIAAPLTQLTSVSKPFT